MIMITLFKSQIVLAEHECSTNLGDCKSKRGKPEYPEKNLSEQSWEPTNSIYVEKEGTEKLNSSSTDLELG